MAVSCQTWKLLTRTRLFFQSEKLLTKCPKIWIRRLAEHPLHPKITVSSQDSVQTKIPGKNTWNYEVLTPLVDEKYNSVQEKGSSNDSEIRKHSEQDYFKDCTKTNNSEKSPVVNGDQSFFQEFHEQTNLAFQDESSIESLEEESSVVPFEQDPLELSDENESVSSVFLKEIGKKDPVPFLNAQNLAAFANYSNTVQNLVKLGVDVSQFEEKPGLPERILRMDFEQDIKPYIVFLHDQGVQADEIGNVITKCPRLLQEELENLQVKVNYFLSKKFDQEAIARIITKSPKILLYTTQKIDQRLGFYQKELELTGDELRRMIAQLPKLVLNDSFVTKKSVFTLHEELGFSKPQMKKMIKISPKLLLKSRRDVIERFEFLHYVARVGLDNIVNFPYILMTRLFIIKQRHLFLHSIGRDQYDPTKENFVSLHALVTGTDVDFCSTVAKASVKKFNDFQRTL